MDKSLLFVFAIAFLSCERTGTKDPDLETYVNTVVREAEKRGYDMNAQLDRLNIIFDDLEGLKIGASKGNTIRLDSVAWKYLTERSRVILLAHEIGHAVLGRGHTNQRLSNGECKSIMHDNSQECSANIFAHRWYQYYLDELFDENTEEPSWYGPPDPLDSVLKTTVVKTSIINGTFVDTLTIDRFRDFEILLNYNGKGEKYDPLLNWNGMLLHFAPVKLNVRLINGWIPQHYLHRGMFKTRVLPAERYRFKIVKIKKFVWLYLNETLIHQFDYDSALIHHPDGDLDRHFFYSAGLYQGGEAVLEINYLN